MSVFAIPAIKEELAWKTLPVTTVSKVVVAEPGRSVVVVFRIFPITCIGILADPFSKTEVEVNTTPLAIMSSLAVPGIMEELTVNVFPGTAMSSLALPAIILEVTVNVFPEVSISVLATPGIKEVAADSVIQLAITSALPLDNCTYP